MEIMYTNSIEQGYFANHNFIGFIGDIKDLRVLVSDLESVKINSHMKVRNEINKNTDFLNLLELDESILKRSIKDLSSTEIKLVKLIKICNLKPDLIILNNFDLGFNYKAKRRLSRFIKTINATYHTKFIIISNDVLFINRCAKHIIIAKNRIIKYQGDIMSSIKQGFIEKPEIIKFIDLANESDAGLDYTLDRKELLKAIYRSVF